MINKELKIYMGSLLTNLRKKKGLLIKEVASAIGRSPLSYHNYERGRALPSLEDMRKLRKVFGFKNIDEMIEAAEREKLIEN